MDYRGGILFFWDFLKGGGDVGDRGFPFLFFVMHMMNGFVFLILGMGFYFATPSSFLAPRYVSVVLRVLILAVLCFVLSDCSCLCF
jgi:hypothetical protein